ncbi:MAG: ATP-binding protein [Variovorax sp.]
MCEIESLRRWATRCVGHLLGWGLLLAAAGAGAVETRNVLVLYSNGRLVPGNVEVEAGLRSAIASSADRPVQVFTEFLDNPEFNGPSYEQTVVTYLNDKYASHPPTVVVAVARESLNFMLRHREVLFPGVAVVHAAVFPLLNGTDAALPTDVVGIPIEYDIAGMLQQALRWHPGVKRLVVVTGSTPRDRDWETLLRAKTAPFGDRLSIEFFSSLPTADLFRRLAALEPDSVVYTAGFYQSGDELNFTPRDSAKAIAQHSAAPVYGPFSTFIGTGVVATLAPRFDTMGRSAGEIVNALMRGATPASLNLPKVMPNELGVDWRQARRRGIADDDIPAGAAVQFRQPSFLEANRTASILGGSVILFQAALIVALILEHRRRRKVELTLVERGSELAHVSRLAVAGELTASIAHEINQPLAAILSNAEAADLLIKSGRADRGELLSILDDIRRDNVRASGVISRLRTLLAKQAPRRQPFELNATIADACELLTAEARRRAVTVVLKTSAEPVPLDGDAVQIQQVVINLLLNAMDAIGDLPEPRRAIHVTVSRRAHKGTVTVSDRGHGIAPEHLAKLFDSFFSTKLRGMGLGLSITQTIIAAHGGRIWAESANGSGAVFHVELPERAEATAAAQRLETA